MNNGKAGQCNLCIKKPNVAVPHLLTLGLWGCFLFATFGGFVCLFFICLKPRKTYATHKYLRNVKNLGSL